MYCYVWEYVVRTEKTRAFERSYGPEGEWVELFQRDPDYLRTLLLADRDLGTRFVTLDFWVSREACERFRTRYRAEMDALDARCEELTLREEHVGDFDIVGKSSGRRSSE